MNIRKSLKYIAGFLVSAAIALAVFVASWGVASFLQRQDGWEASSAAGQWAGALATLAGFAFVVFQLHQERKKLESHTRELAGQTTWMVYSNGLTTLNIFVEHPELRPYFYGDNVPVPAVDDASNAWLRSRIFAAAEMLADHWESTVIAEDMKQQVNQLWLGYMMSIYCRSPALREYLQHANEGFRYSTQFTRMLADCDCAKIGLVKAGKLSLQELCKPHA